MKRKKLNHDLFLIGAGVLVCLLTFYGFDSNDEAPALLDKKDLALLEPAKNKGAKFSGGPLLSSEEKAFTNAEWITYGREIPTADSLLYLAHPAPIFRKEFKSKGEISKATLYITSAGYYKGSINGEAIGKNVLDPAWTDYSKRTYYTAYEITQQLKEGSNCLGVTLGNGFYNPLPLRKWGRRNLRTDLTVGKPTFIAQLVIAYKNGETDTINTDNTWKYTYGPIQKNSVYLGTVYDAKQEIENWNQPGFNDASWSKAIPDKGPGGKLQQAFFPPVQVTQTITPVAITNPEQGTYVVDMGVNFTGTYKIKLSGKVGDTINFRFGERIYDDGTLNPMTTVIGQIKKKGIGGPGAPEIAWQTDSYIVGKESPSWFEPEFTYHVYRYMEIKGLEKAPALSDIQGLLMHTHVSEAGEFNSSSELLNSIQEITRRSFVTNLISVQSDCAAREKFGYGGDLNATSESYINNYDMQDIYKKTVYDWIDAMKDSSFVDTAPFAGVAYCGISWESAYLTTQYYIYLYYNDVAFVKELYSKNKEWMDKVARIHPEGLVNNGLSDHESLEPVPVQLTGTAHYLQCAEIMETFAKVMGDKENELKYAALAEHLRELIKNEFWDKAVTKKINRQTLFSTLLYHNIIPKEELGAAKDSLQKALKNGPSAHFNTGIFGTKYILEAASKNLSPEVVYDVVNSKAFPGWGFMVDNGATTLWETWKESDNTFSNNHPMFGSVSEWFYRWLGGIRPDPEHPGFKKFVLSPSTPEGLEFVNTKYNSPYGPIVSNWKKLSANSYEYSIEIPKGTTAKISLALDASQKITVLKEGVQLKSKKRKALKTGDFDLEEGQYTIIVSPKA
ncbi:family 78 glycoside hydrolase catalytic domain [Zobellia uliginosa]|uniref:family 78 glycoside hydrolase catalytic domain n=1 Tax=Zobellia uliginosa TaxID=143224 RepID=UPI0026E421D0|nr:family 78 glycoside hydrolase catalytic domain [Zobellia uliginosa]MDO6518695.1 family 78 glycoside hydrolase catalytic domain [Zobellia uliginosa]